MLLPDILESALESLEPGQRALVRDAFEGESESVMMAEYGPSRREIRRRTREALERLRFVLRVRGVNGVADVLP